MNRIKINDRFSIEQDKLKSWHLIENIQSKGRDGKPKVTEKISYYANLSQIAKEIANRYAGDCTRFPQLLVFLEAAKPLATPAMHTIHSLKDGVSRLNGSELPKIERTDDEDIFS